MVDWIKQKCVNLELLENYFNLLIWFEKHKPKIIFLNGKSHFTNPSQIPLISPWFHPPDSHPDFTLAQFFHKSYLILGIAFTVVIVFPDSPSTTRLLVRAYHKTESTEHVPIWDSVICVLRMNIMANVMALPWATGLKSSIYFSYATCTLHQLVILITHSKPKKLLMAIFGYKQWW